MFVFPATNAPAALPTNQAGRLATDQFEAIQLIFRNRGKVGLIIAGSALFLAAISSLGLLLPSSEPTNSGTTILLAIFSAIWFFDATWGVWIYRASKKAQTELTTGVMVKSTTGVPNKYNYGTAVRVAGATHTMITRHGWIKVNGESYGVLQGELYQQISDTNQGAFYYVDMPRVPGFKPKLVVNYHLV